jgi:hypothetical protein
VAVTPRAGAWGFVSLVAAMEHAYCLGTSAGGARATFQSWLATRRPPALRAPPPAPPHGGQRCATRDPSQRPPIDDRGPAPPSQVNQPDCDRTSIAPQQRADPHDDPRWPRSGRRRAHPGAPHAAGRAGPHPAVRSVRSARPATTVVVGEAHHAVTDPVSVGRSALERSGARDAPAPLA